MAGHGSDYQRGHMDIAEQAATFNLVMGMTKWGSLAIAAGVLFFVLVAPESSTGAHLKALARISRVFKDPEFRRRLLAAPDAEAMYHVVAEEDAKY